MGKQLEIDVRIGHGRDVSAVLQIVGELLERYFMEKWKINDLQ